MIVAVSGGRALRPGSAVTVRLGSARREAVVVPRDVVAEDGYVLVREGGRAVLRAVTLGPEVAAGQVEVLAGLSAGERVARPRR